MKKPRKFSIIALYKPCVGFSECRLRRVCCWPERSVHSFLTTVLLIAFAATLAFSLPLHAAEPHFLGPQTCATSLCHGGAGDARHQFHIWSKRDFHSGSYATLTTARSEQIIRALESRGATKNDATTAPSCVACHAPLTGLPSKPDPTGSDHYKLDPRDGVSCESCHGAAESWIRSHTRTDYSHQRRVAAGQRDLRNLYSRANACVACHQNLDAPLLAAGHPELLFELDGQTLAEPRHWREQGSYNGAQAWFVGQAVALRELSAATTTDKPQSRSAVESQTALEWLFRNLGQIDPDITDPKQLPMEASKASQAIKIADAIARDAAQIEWSDDLTLLCLNRLASVAGDFETRRQKLATHARRAERLALAIDRLVASLDAKKTKALEPHINQIFKLSQSSHDFDPKAFAAELRAFQSELKQSGLTP